MLDISLMRLQYEILNTSVEQLSQESGISVKMLRNEIEQGGWKQMWPDITPVATEESEGLDPFETETNSYIENNRRRLKAYSLAKELMLASRYLELEVNIIDKANDLISTLDKAQDVKYLSALYKDLTSNSNLANLATMALGQDESGMPTLVVRDLSGN